MENYLEGLAKKLEEDNLAIDVDKEGGYSVRLTLDSIGEKEEGVVLLEMMKIDIEGMEDYSFYNFFTVLAVNADENKAPAVLDNLNNLNKETLLGNYGLVKEEGIIYHKYIAKVPNLPSDEGVGYLYSSLVDILAVIDNDYNRAITTEF